MNLKNYCYRELFQEIGIIGLQFAPTVTYYIPTKVKNIRATLKLYINVALILKMLS